MVGVKEEPENSPGGDGYVESLPHLDAQPEPCTSGGHLVRQVPCPAPFEQSPPTVRKREYARLTGKERAYIKGQTYTLLSHQDNLTLDGRRALKKLLAANKRLHTAYLLKESFSQLWDYDKEGLGQTILRARESLAEMATVETV